MTDACNSPPTPDLKNDSELIIDLKLFNTRSHRSMRQQVQLNSSLLTSESVRHGRKDIMDEEAAEYIYKRDQSPKPAGGSDAEENYGIDTDGLPDIRDEPKIRNACECHYATFILPQYYLRVPCYLHAASIPRILS